MVEVGDSIVWLAGVIAAIISLTVLITKVVHWVDNQKLQDEKIKELEEKHNEDIKAIKEELTVLSYGVLATLKGLSGDSSNVLEAANKMEKHLNKRAHE